MKEQRSLLSALAAVVLLHAVAVAQDPSLPDARRAAFLRLIDRPRVPLAAQAGMLRDSELYAAEHFSFASEAGERVTGILMSRAERSEAPGVTTRRHPAVIVLHGTGARKEEQLALLRSLADRGFVAVAVDARYHGERAHSADSIADYTNAILQAYRTGRGHPYMYDTVWDTMRLVDYLVTRGDVDARRIGLMGLSKGGTETYLTAAVDPRIAVSVPVIGVQGFRWALDHDAWQPRVATFQSAVDAAARDRHVPVDAAFVRQFYSRVAPGIDGEFDAPAMLPLIAPRPLLVINGDSDPRTPLGGVQECIASAERAYAANQSQDKLGFYLQPHAGHVFTPVAELVALDWFVKWLRP